MPPSSLKIAMLGLRCIGGQQTGGVERHVEELAVRMASAGHHLTVFCRSRYNPEGNRSYKGVTLKNCPAIYSKHLEAISHTLLVMPHVLSGFDIVHIHATGPSLLSWLPRLSGRKVIVTVHGLDFQRAKWAGLASLVLRAGSWTAVHCPNKTIVVSKAIKKYYLDHDGSQTNFIPNGVSAPVLRPLNQLKRFGLVTDGYLLSLGRLVPEKGLHYLIEAFSKIDTPLKLVIAGDSLLDDSYERQLRQMASADERIVFTGALFDEDKDEAYSNARAFMLPSDLEGLPITMLEALSYGCPVIASDIPQCAELCEEATREADKGFCFMFKAGQIESLRQKIILMLAEQEKKSVHEAARQHILSVYNWDKITAATLGLYGQALSGRG